MHYVILRADDPTRYAQCVHAAGESAPNGTKPGTIAVCLYARDQEHLKDIAMSLSDAGIKHHIVEECDGEWMAIGCEPTTNRAAMRKVLSSLPLAK